MFIARCFASKDCICDALHISTEARLSARCVEIGSINYLFDHCNIINKITREKENGLSHGVEHSVFCFADTFWRLSKLLHKSYDTLPKNYDMY